MWASTARGFVSRGVLRRFRNTLRHRMARTGFLIRNLILLSLPCVAMSIASSSLNLAGGLVTLDPSNIPEHVDMSNYPSPTSSPSESPWGSNSDLRRLHQATTGAINPNMWRTGKEFKASRLRCVSVIPNCTFLLVLSGKSVQVQYRCCSHLGWV